MDRQSARLKKLIEDLLEASKASTEADAKKKQEEDEKTRKTRKDLVKVGNYCYLTLDPNANPKIVAKLLSNGMESLYLDFYYGFQMVYDEKKDKEVAQKMRGRESLKLYLYHKPQNAIQRQANKETLMLAEKVRYEKAQELLKDEKGYRIEEKKAPLNFIAFFQEYNKAYTKKDIRMMQIAYNRFIDFLKDTQEYAKYARLMNIKPQQIDRDMMGAFTEYLQSRSKGEGAKSIFQRFKKVYKAMAVKYDFNYQAPFIDADGKTISIKVDDSVIVKDVLSADEVKRLIATHYPNESKVIRDAFIFCLNTGLRFCDVKDLTYGNIDEANRVLTFEQNKTKGHSASSGVVIPLNDGLLRLIGEPTSDQSKDSLIFPLPSYEMCLKAIKRWVKRAGINKHISWHCARHSFAVNILNNGANIKTVASLLGHSGLKHTEKYTRAIDSLKQDAINSLPELNI